MYRYCIVKNEEKEEDLNLNLIISEIDHVRSCYRKYKEHEENKEKDNEDSSSLMICTTGVILSTDFLFMKDEIKDLIGRIGNIDLSKPKTESIAKAYPFLKELLDSNKFL